MVVFVFFGSLFRSDLSDIFFFLKAGFQFVGWCMINIVSKNHTQVRNIERGMANLPLSLAVTWPAQLVAPRRNSRILTESATKENREVQINAKNGLSIPETNGRTTRRKEKTKKEGEHGERHKNVGNGLVVLLYVLRSWYK